MNKKIKALLHLVDDPDQEVFDTVAHQLLNYGTEIIPNLEHLWEITEDEAVQFRIEILIHRALFTKLQDAFLEWSKEKNPSLLKGALLVAQYHYPNLDIAAALALFEQIKRNIWLELNNFLAPLEQINVINSILYSYYKFKGHELTERNADLFFVNQLLENKKGNVYSIGIVILSLCEALDVPIFAVNLPRQFVVGYFDSLFNFFSSDNEPIQNVQFYIDPLNGLVYTQSDVDVYLKKINADGNQDYMQPMTNKQVIIQMLEELAITYDYNKEEEKAIELRQLISIIA